MSESNAFAATVLVVARDGFGSAEPALPHALMGKYLGLLLAGGLTPRAVCFVTEGVHLACDGSPVLEELRKLGERGCRLLVCTTCLEFYGLKEKVRAGTACGMPDILNAQLEATKVISI
jgi:hypothetical protein